MKIRYIAILSLVSLAVASCKVSDPEIPGNGNHSLVAFSNNTMAGFFLHDPVMLLDAALDVDTYFTMTADGMTMSQADSLFPEGLTPTGEGIVEIKSLASFNSFGKSLRTLGSTWSITCLNNPRYLYRGNLKYCYDNEPVLTVECVGENIWKLTDGYVAENSTVITYKGEATHAERVGDVFEVVCLGKYVDPRKKNYSAEISTKGVAVTEFSAAPLASDKGYDTRYAETLSGAYDVEIFKDGERQDFCYATVSSSGKVYVTSRD